jgi:hypothetical protein
MVQSAGVASETDQPDEYKYFEQSDPELGMAAEYVETSFLAKNKNKKKKKSYRPQFMTTNAISLSDDVQLITRFFGEPNEIHENYDFVHCKSFYSSWNKRLDIPKEVMECLLTKELKYVGSRYPICSLIRMRKFLSRDWHITAGQILKMAWQVSELDLGNVEVLTEQMAGVDLAYFMEVIEALKKRDEKRVDASYLFEILDKIF